MDDFARRNLERRKSPRGVPDNKAFIGPPTENAPPDPEDEQGDPKDGKG